MPTRGDLDGAYPFAYLHVERELKSALADAGEWHGWRLVQFR